jgi:hypothetical protein
MKEDKPEGQKSHRTVNDEDNVPPRRGLSYHKFSNRRKTIDLPAAI